MRFLRKLLDPGLRNGLSIGELLDALQKYAEAVDQEPRVFDEIVSDLVHIDMHVFEPMDGVPHRQILTTGASMYAMPTPSVEDQFAEYMVLLPSTWSTEASEFIDEKVWWPYRVLKQVARIPVEQKSAIREFVSFPFGAPHTKKPGTEFAGAMLVRPYFLPEDRRFMLTPNGRRIHLFCVMPLYESEIEYKVRHDNADALWKLAMDNGRDAMELCLVNPDRAPII